MRLRIASLAGFSAQQVRDFAKGHTVDVDVVDRRQGQHQVPGLVARAQVVIGDPGSTYRLDREAIACMGNCRLIVQPSAGLDSVDLDAAREFRIPVAHTAGFNATAVADWVIMAALMMLRGGHSADTIVRRGNWDRPPLGRELGALTFGIVGMGNIGRAVARRLGGFGGRVLFASRSPFTIEGAARVSLPEVLRGSDILSLHVPLTVETAGLIGPQELASMPAGSLLINTSRGGVVDETALVRALRAGTPAMAALDVFEAEPLPEDSPLRTMPNVLLSPHIATRTETAAYQQRMMTTRIIRDFLAGRAVPGLVVP